MKTLVLNANSDKKINHIILGRINTIFPKSKKHFVFKFLKNAPRSIQGVKDGLIAKSEMIKFFNKKENKKFDNYILCCFDDIALEEIRSIVNKPVFSLCQSSLFYCQLVDGKSAILTINKNSVPVIKKLLKKYKAYHVKVNSLNLDISNIYDKNFFNNLQNQISQLIAKSNIQNVILGSTGLTKYKEQLQKKFNLNFIDGLECSLYLSRIKV
jgi:allantoin racemase